jgi:crotonobetainyl-CoA:carnitine CoA-transferase CaiB-like acyl-CoA transferase
MERTAEEWVAAFDKAGVPVAPVAFPEEMADSPQVLADGMIYELVHSITGPQRVVGPIVTMSKTPAGPHRAAPALGEHTREVLLERGVPEAEIDSLLAADVLYQG